MSTGFAMSERPGAGRSALACIRRIPAHGLRCAVREGLGRRGVGQAPYAPDRRSGDRSDGHPPPHLRALVPRPSISASIAPGQKPRLPQLGRRLATADSSRSFAFYRDGLGLEAFGGVPEPLQLRLASNVSLMLIPTGGFAWLAGEDRVAPPDANCALRLRP
jgi:hypothetical protein